MNCKKCKYWQPVMENGQCVNADAGKILFEVISLNSQMPKPGYVTTPADFGCLYWESLERFSFDEAWKIYPRKMGRDAALKHFKAQIKTKAQYDMIIKAIEYYASQCYIEKRTENYILQGSTFFNSRWKEYYELAVKNKKTTESKKDYKFMNYEEEKTL